MQQRNMQQRNMQQRNMQQCSMQQRNMQQRNSASKSQCNSATVATMWLVPEWDNSAPPDNTRCCNSARCISAASAAKTPLATSRPLCFRHSTSAPGLGPHPRRDSGAFDEALRTVLHRIGAYTADRPSPVRPRSRPPHPSVLCVRAVRSLRRSRVISAPMRRGCRVGYGRGALRQLASGAVASLRAARSAGQRCRRPLPAAR
jgi:hypothetical protein